MADAQPSGTATPAPDYFSDYPFTFALDPRTTAFVPIDLQYGSASRGVGLGRVLAQQGRQGIGSHRFDRIEQVVVPNVQRLLAFFRGHGLRVIYLTVGSEMPDYSDISPHKRAFTRAKNNTRGQREHEILDEIKPLPGELVINKTTPSAFNSSSFEAALRNMGIETCLFGGVSTNVCVEGTARDAADRGFNALIVADCCGATRPEFHDMTLLTFPRTYGRVASTEQVIAELGAALPGGSAVP